MAWVKIPPEHHPLFLAVIPNEPGVEPMRMFGAVCAMVNGNMAGGLFARSMIVRLSAEDQKRALALEGAGPFDPMGNGRVMKDTIMLPESVMEHPEQMREWLERAIAYSRTLPPKAKKAKPATRAAKTRAKPASAAKKKQPARAAKKSAARKKKPSKSARKKRR